MKSVFISCKRKTTMTSLQSPEQKDFKANQLLPNPEKNLGQSSKQDNLDFSDNCNTNEKQIVNFTNGSGKKPEGFFVTKKALGIGCAVFAGILALSAGIVMLNIKRTGANTTPTTIGSNYTSSSDAENSQIAISGTELSNEETQAIDTKETADASTENIDYTKTIYNIVEGYNFDSLTTEQQTEIKKYELMSKEEFQALTQEEQAILGDWVLENYGPRFDVILENSNIDLHHTENPQTAEEILGNYAYLTSMCLTLVELNADGNGAHENVELGQKVLLSLRDTVTTNHLISINNWVEQTGGGIGVFDVDMEVIEYKNNSDGSIIINNTWKTTDNITVETDAQFSQKTFIPFTFVDIHGESKTIYLRSIAVGKDDVKYIDIS